MLYQAITLKVCEGQVQRKSYSSIAGPGHVEEVSTLRRCRPKRETDAVAASSIPVQGPALLGIVLEPSRRINMHSDAVSVSVNPELCHSSRIRVDQLVPYMPHAWMRQAIAKSV